MGPQPCTSPAPVCVSPSLCILAHKHGESSGPKTHVSLHPHRRTDPRKHPDLMFSSEKLVKLLSSRYTCEHNALGGGREPQRPHGWQRRQLVPL